MRTRASGVVLHQGKVLLLRRIKKGEEYYVFPGGGVESGETPEQAAVREVAEETGIQAVVDSVLDAFDHWNNHQYYFLMKAPVGEIQLGGPERDRMTEDNQYYPGWYDIATALHFDNLYPERVKKLLITYIR